ncbi:MAG TPA: hypothetical protein VMW27_28660 [Thermoanaerobaculia bacterium]|nr:hypothetical protein [Thermoanaerobaculia bacterium]
MADGERARTRREEDPFRRGQEERRRITVELESLRDLLDDALQQAVLVPADPGALPWVSLGPRNVGGRIRALAADPRHPGRIFAGSAFGGVWRTDDGGDIWLPLDALQPPVGVRQAVPVGAIAVAPSNPQILYLGTGEPVVDPGESDDFFPGNGLYRSSDGGATFQEIDHPERGILLAHRFERILVDPWEPDRCWIACPRGLFRQEPGAAFVQELIDPPDAPTVEASRDASDVAIDFGNPAGTPPATFTVYVALRDKGIYRRVYERASGSYAGTGWERLERGLPSRNIHRIKLALCRAQPRYLYAVFAETGETASRVYRSSDRGDHWDRTGRREGDDRNEQASYNLVLEVHPENPDIAFFGAVDLFRTLNGGESWTKVLNSDHYDSGARAEHADQHALLFDPVDPRRIWVANDGGISMSPDLGGSWRKRSHGILAAQLYDLTTHPRYPFLFGGGLQDNGSWMSLGSSGWIEVNGGDGGSMAFDPASPNSFLSIWQEGIDRVQLGAAPGPDDYTVNNQAPDLGGFLAVATPLSQGISADHGPVFSAPLEHHPARAGHALVGRKGAGYLTTDGGASFRLLRTGPFTPADAAVTALAYAPGAPDDEWWLGTGEGGLFVTVDGSSAAETWTPVTLPTVRQISQIAVHPTDSDIVAVALTGSPPRLYLSGTKGVTWWEISGTSMPLTSPSPTDSLGDTPLLCVAFDPRSPGGVGTDQTLYVGTLAGVYVIRNARPALTATPPAGTPAPVWRTFNRELPLTMVTDLHAVVERNAAPIVVRQALRCATHGRGAWECDLAGAPEVRLYIRDTVIDDGRRHEGDAVLTDDPRQTPPTPLPPLQSFDIRVDAPPFSFFEETLDGVEFDEELAPASPAAGERNIVYVQVHNGGWQDAAGVTVHLFWTAVPAPPAVPDLQIDFWTNLIAPPAGDWQVVAPARSLRLLAGQPAVAAFDWTPPAALTGKAALLAVAEHASDPMPPVAALPLVITDLLQHHPRAAVRVVDVTAFTPDVFLRDGIDDDGRAGSVAWGGRSPDVIVTQAVVADPDADFRNLGDRRTGDKVQGGVDNHAYLRLHNRKSVPLDVSVELFNAPLATLHDHATWTRLGGSGPVQVPPKGWRFAPVITWTPVDPEPAAPAEGKAYALVAVAVLADDPGPDFPAMTDLKDFWRRLLSGSLSNNAALRVLPFEA